MDISAENVKKLINKDIDIIVFDEVTSTNDVAKILAEKDASEGTVVIAKKQTSGRGRKGHTFFSPKDTGLYMSIILRPAIAPEDSLLITTSAAVSVAEATEKVSGVSTFIKWVNDVYADGKKIAGILSEAMLSEDMTKTEYVILGIGVNVNEPDGGFPDDIRNIAGALRKNKEDIRDVLAASIINTFFSYYEKLPEKTFFDEYRQRLFILGKKIDVIKPDSVTEAVALDIDSDFGLIVQYPDGRKETLTSGEVSAKPKE